MYRYPNRRLSYSKPDSRFHDKSLVHGDVRRHSITRDANSPLRLIDFERTGEVRESQLFHPWSYQYTSFTKALTENNFLTYYMITLMILHYHNKKFISLLELMIPPTERPGSVVVTRPASHGEVPGSNPGLVVLFSLTILAATTKLEICDPIFIMWMTFSLEIHTTCTK